MYVNETEELGEYWGGTFTIKQKEFVITAKELVNYLIENGYDEIPDRVEMTFDGDIYEVDTFEVLKGKKAEIKRFYHEAELLS